MRSLKRFAGAAIFLALAVGAASYAQTSKTVFDVKATVQPNRVAPGGKAELVIQLLCAEEAHVYPDSVHVTVGPTEGLEFGKPVLPPPTHIFDEALGKESDAYVGNIEIRVPVRVQTGATSGKVQIDGSLEFRGCVRDQCFFPDQRPFSATLTVDALATETTTESAATTTTKKEKAQTTPTTSSQGSTDVGETLRTRGLLLTLILVFFGGIGVSLTPCIYPMIPVTISLIGSQAQGSSKRAFLLSLVYVLGISITYAVLGVVAATTGSLFGAALQSKPVVIGIAALFVVLALGMFDVYYLQVPPSLQSKLSSVGGAGVVGLFLMGMSAGLIVSPCVGPILASLLVYIASTGNELLGFLLLFVFAWGMGLLLIIVGTFSGLASSLPKSGDWMNTVKHFFGFVMFCAALYYLRLAIPATIHLTITGIFLVVTAVFAGGFDTLTPESTGLHRTRKAFGLLCFLGGIALLLHVYAAQVVPPRAVPAQAVGAAAEAGQIAWTTDLKTAEKEASRTGKPVLIDFWAEWCGVCKEMEETTFVDPRVVELSKKFLCVRIDMTDESSEAAKHLKERYKILGLPTLVLEDPDGTVVQKISHGLSGKELAQEMEKVLQTLEQTSAP